MDLTEIAPRVHRLGVPTSGVFLLLDAGITIVDTGPRWSRGRILRAIQELGRDPSDVDRIVLTHAHFDHVGSLASFDGHGHLRRHAHRTEAAVIRGERPVTMMDPAVVTTLYHRLLSRFVQPRSESDAHLEDGDVLPVLGGMRVVSAPGHTDGHVALLIEELGVLLSADALQVRRGELTPPLIFGDRGEAAASLERLAGLDFEVLAPSHFAPMRDEARARLAALAASFRAS